MHLIISVYCRKEKNKASTTLDLFQICNSYTNPPGWIWESCCLLSFSSWLSHSFSMTFPLLSSISRSACWYFPSLHMQLICVACQPTQLLRLVHFHIKCGCAAKENQGRLGTYSPVFDEWTLQRLWGFTAESHGPYHALPRPWTATPLFFWAATFWLLDYPL